MRKFATIALGIGMATAFAGATLAAPASSMTSSEKTTWTKCQGMSQTSMQKDSQCQALMKKYPDAGKGTTGSGMSGSSSSGMSGSTSSGGMKK